jgi:hypothetical protein
MKILKVAALGLLLAAPVQALASIHRCSEWSDAGLSHRGDVIVSLDGDTLTWKADRAESSAHLVNKVLGAATYSDGHYVYFVFGIFGFDLLPDWIDLIRRVAMTRKSGFGEITCLE